MDFLIMGLFKSLNFILGVVESRWRGLSKWHHQSWVWYAQQFPGVEGWWQDERNGSRMEEAKVGACRNN